MTTMMATEAPMAVSASRSPSSELENSPSCDVQLGHRDRDPDHHEGVVDPHQVEAEEQGQQDHRDRPVGVVAHGGDQQRPDADADDGAGNAEEALAGLLPGVVDPHEGDERCDDGPVEAASREQIAERDGGADGDTHLDGGPGVGRERETVARAPLPARPRPSRSPGPSRGASRRTA